MDLERLKKMLEDGKITQEQYDEIVGSNPKNEPKDNNPNEPEGKTDIDRLIQSAVDRAIHKISNENKRLKLENEKIKKEKMTAEERAELEKEQEREQFEQERAEFQREKNKLYAIKAIKTAGLDDGSDMSLELVDFVMDSDPKNIDEKIKSFGALVKKFVQAEVDKTFKANGRNPGKGTAGAGKNPYAKETYNLTEQMRLEAENPELAKTMKAAAGK